jgi:hypothetical protein
MIYLAAALIAVQTGVGMVVNLYVTIPSHHPGAGASNYFGGSASSVAWALGHGAPALVIHASLGLLLAVLAIGVAVRGVMRGRRSVGAWSVLATLLVIGAGFNGASFLDYNHDISSLIMALLAMGALLCYLVVIYLCRTGPTESPAESPAG